MIDAVGGVDVTVKEAFDDPTYDGFGFEDKGYAIEAGDAPPRWHERPGLRPRPQGRRRERLHPGRPPAADPRRPARRGDRQRRQPAVRAPGRCSTRSATRSVTDLPPERLPELAAIVDEIDDDAVTRVVIRHPLVKSRIDALRVVARPERQGHPGGRREALPDGRARRRMPWPTPKPTRDAQAEPDARALAVVAPRTRRGGGASAAPPRPDARSRSWPRRVHSPSVRPPTGSGHGSKIGS